MTGHRKWADTKELRRGLDLRLAVQGEHFLQYMLGGGDATVPVWECRDCGLEVTLNETERAAWREWIIWCITAPIELVEAAQERSHCGS